MLLRVERQDEESGVLQMDDRSAKPGLQYKTSFFLYLRFPVCNLGDNDSTTALTELQVSADRALSAQHAVSQ